MLKPEKRPFSIGIYNTFSRLIGKGSTLSFDRLLKQARKNTRLTDLGIDFNENALEILINSINEEAKLNAFGRLMIKEKLISQLENRLWAEHWFKKHPEILDREVLPIVMITGLQRTGTTKMQRLLSRVPGARALYSWEALYPAPIGCETETKNRIQRTKRNERAVKWISPAFHSIHPIHTNEPEEDVLLLDVHFMSTSSEAIMHVPSYAEWLNKQDQKKAYFYEEKLLKLLQWQRAGKFWVLKSPHHLQYLDAFQKVFPKSNVIWMHRSIDASVPSFLSMLYYSRNMFTDQVDKNVLKNQWLNKLEEMVNEGLKFRNKLPKKIIDVGFSDFIASESSILDQISQQLNFNIDIEGLKINNGQNRNFVSNHRYKLSDWDLNTDELNTRFANYYSAVKLTNS